MPTRALTTSYRMIPVGTINLRAIVIIQCVRCELKLQRITGGVGRVRELRDGKYAFVFKCPTCGGDMKEVEKLSVEKP
jgi:hypothetical protein